MKMSQLFPQTLREAPSEADTVNHQYLLRAGFIRPLAAGIFTYLHLAKKSFSKIENIIRQEMNAIGGQEISMPIIHPAEIWQETGRWQQIGDEMGRFRDRGNRDMVLAMTHEEVIADLARKEIHSYRHLPLLLYHIQTKWRDEPRVRGGLIRVREFTMKDSYSLDVDTEGLDRQYRAHYQAYHNIFRRCGIPVTAVKSDVGMMGGQLAHEFMYISPIGDDTLLLCDQCGYSANRQVARFMKPIALKEQHQPMIKIPTPGIKTIEALADFLQVSKAKTAKAVFVVAKKFEGNKPIEQFIFAIVRGDMEVNETKLVNALHASEIRPAREDEIRAVGAVPGFASPVGLSNIFIIIDDIIPSSPNLVAGANDEGYHLLNVNYGRDYQADLVSDIASAEEHSACPTCKNPMRTARSIEVGNLFKLGTRYSLSMGCNFLDRDGQIKPIQMGSYGIGSGRLLACIVEEHHDDLGIIWPISVAPYPIHLVLLPGKVQKEEGNQSNILVDFAEDLYRQLNSAGMEPLYDDRSESPWVKFNDADLIGLPIRLTVSERALQQGGVEMKRRGLKEKTIFPADQLIPMVRQLITELENNLNSTVKEAPFQ